MSSIIDLELSHRKVYFLQSTDESSLGTVEGEGVGIVG